MWSYQWFTSWISECVLWQVAGILEHCTLLRLPGWLSGISAELWTREPGVRASAWATNAPWWLVLDIVFPLVQFSPKMPHAPKIVGEQSIASDLNCTVLFISFVVFLPWHYNAFNCVLTSWFYSLAAFKAKSSKIATRRSLAFEILKL